MNDRGKLKKALGRAFSTFCAALFACTVSLAESSPSVVAFGDSGFPAADSASSSPDQLQQLLPAARLSTAEQLRPLLNTPGTRLLVLPYGSAFPEDAWPDTYQFLGQGGNLLVLVGRPFTRAAYRDSGGGWHLRDYSVRFTRPLGIDQYQVTPGSDGPEFQTNPDLALPLSRFAWKRAFSLVIRLSAVDLYARGGSAGSIDARLDALVWGTRDSRKLAAPALQVDHLRNGFDGGRWIFLNAELTPEFYGSAEAPELIRSLAERALGGSEEFAVRRLLPLYWRADPVQLDIVWHSAEPSAKLRTVRITSFPEAQPSDRTVTTTALPSSQPLVLPALNTKGLQIH